MIEIKYPTGQPKNETAVRIKITVRANKKIYHQETPSHTCNNTLIGDYQYMNNINHTRWGGKTIVTNSFQFSHDRINNNLNRTALMFVKTFIKRALSYYNLTKPLEVLVSFKNLKIIVKGEYYRPHELFYIFKLVRQAVTIIAYLYPALEHQKDLLKQVTKCIDKEFEERFIQNKCGNPESFYLTPCFTKEHVTLIKDFFKLKTPTQRREIYLNNHGIFNIISYIKKWSMPPYGYAFR